MFIFIYLTLLSLSSSSQSNLKVEDPVAKIRPLNKRGSPYNHHVVHRTGMRQTTATKTLHQQDEQNNQFSRNYYYDVTKLLRQSEILQSDRKYSLFGSFFSFFVRLIMRRKNRKTKIDLKNVWCITQSLHNISLCFVQDKIPNHVFINSSFPTTMINPPHAQPVTNYTRNFSINFKLMVRNLTYSNI